MIRRRLIAATPLLLLLSRTQAADPTPKETTWEDLMPKDWDPLKDLRLGDVGLVAEGSAKERNMMRQMREIWDNAPTNPKMDGARVRLPGYVVPLEEVKGELQEFLLVPYFGACVHSPPPPANQIIHVLPQSVPKGVRSMDPVWISGTLVRGKVDSYMGAAAYRMDAKTVEPYVERPR